MTYTAKTVQELREESGSLLKKIASETKLIETQIGTIDALADGKILVGNGSGVATEVDMSGDAKIVASGAVTIQADSVENTMLANITRGSIKVGGASDAPTDLAAKATGNILVGDDTDLKSVAMSGDVTIIANGTTTIGADKVANTMLENMTQGTIKVGGAANAPTDLNAKTSGYILVGDDTDIASVAVSGDVALASNGAVTIQADSVENTMLANITRGSVKVGGASDAPTDLDAKTAGQILVGDDTDLKSVAVSGDVSLAADGEVTIASGVVTPTMTETMTNGKIIIGVTGGPNIADVLSGDVTMDAAGAVTIATDSVENTMLANITRGSVKVGGVDDAPTDLDGKTSGQILVGDGTDIASVAISGDVDISANGLMTIQADSVENTMLANIARGSIKVGGASDAPTDLDASGNGYIVVGDGTDVASVAVSGDVSLANTGAVTIASDAVENSMVAPTYMKVVSGALTAGVADTIAFAWKNPEDAKILVHRVIIDITAAGGTGASVMDVGVVANATSTAADIFNDIDNNAIAVLDHLLVAGAGVGGVHKVDEADGTNDHITGKILTQAASSLAGKYYIMYTEVAA